MVDAAPFRALRYDPRVAGDALATSAPAYDDVGRFTYAHHRAVSPYTVLELLTPAGTPAYERWRRTGVLVEEPEPAVYVYEEHELRHGVPAVQRGVLVALGLAPLGSTVLPHEQVDVGRVADRLERLAAVPVDVAPVFALYRDAPAALTDLLTRPPARAPLVAMTDEAGIDHRIWPLTDPHDLATVREGFSDLRVVIADGHHRYVTALAFAAQRGAAHGDPPWARTLAYLVDVDRHGPVVLPVHRLLRRAPADLVDCLRADFRVEPGPADLDALATELAALDGVAYGLRLPDGRGLLLRAHDSAALRRRLPAERSPLWRQLDAAVLTGAVLPSLDLPDDAVEPAPDAAAAAGEVERGTAAALLLLRPVPAATVHELAAGGETLPPKTTSFRPKPRTGLILRSVV